MATPLTDATVNRIARLFSSTDRVLKPSDGDLSQLHQAIEWAETDWRDVLLAAGFGGDLTAHRSSWPDVWDLT